jgi:hypothetical protein
MTACSSFIRNLHWFHINLKTPYVTPKFRTQFMYVNKKTSVYVYDWHVNWFFHAYVKLLHVLFYILQKINNSCTFFERLFLNSNEGLYILRYYSHAHISSSKYHFLVLLTIENHEVKTQSTLIIAKLFISSYMQISQFVDTHTEKEQRSTVWRCPSNDIHCVICLVPAQNWLWDRVSLDIR